MRCPGQDFKLWEDLIFSFMFGGIFFLCGLPIGILTFLVEGNALFSFLYLPLMIYLIGSTFLFLSVRLNS